MAEEINPIKLLRKYYEYPTIIEHSKTVARVALLIAKLIKENNPKTRLNLEDVKNAALLHDLDKTLTLPENHGKAVRLCRKLKISEDKIKHGQLSYEILRREGMRKYAVVARQHTFFKIISSDRPKTLLSKIVYYADKRCGGSKIVTLKERFAFWKKKYYKTNSKETNELVSKAKNEVFKLQNDLLSLMNISLAKFNKKMRDLNL